MRSSSARTPGKARTRAPAAPRPAGSAWVALGLGLLAVLLYANTFHHDYVLDDDIVARRNALVQQGVAGLPGIFSHGFLYGFNGLDYFYRPLPLASLAIEVELFGNDPRVHHVANVVLFAACVVLLYLLLLALLEPPAARLPDRADAPPRLVALVTALLFAVHPIHTEVVANIKSRDELLGLLFTLLALRLLVAHADTRRPPFLAASLLAYALGVLSKETGLAVLGLVPLTLWFFRTSDLRRIAAVTAPFALVAGGCLLLRHAVAGDALPEDPAARAINNALAAAGTPGVRLASSVAVLGRYLWLLVLPHPLSYDYSYNQVPLVGPGHWRFLVALAAHAGLLAVAARGLARKQVVAYAVLFYATTLVLVSNLVVPLGTVMGERLLFTPSVGFCLAAAWLLVALAGRGSRAPWLVPALGVILVLYAARTITRNRDWKDAQHLYTSGVRTAPNSARAWNHYASWRLGRGAALPDGAPERAADLRAAVSGYARALDILPAYSEASFNLGVAYVALGDTAAARACYERTLQADSAQEGALDNLAGILYREGKVAEARRLWLKLLAANPRHAGACGNLGATYLREGDELSRGGDPRAASAAFRAAAGWFQKAHDLSPDAPEYVRDLVTTYSRLGDEAATRRWMERLREP